MDILPIQSLAQLSLHLKSLRKARGLKQVQLAQRLGITQSRYAQIERDPGKISTARLLELLAILGADIHLQLRGRKTPVTKPVRGEDW